MAYVTVSVTVWTEKCNFLTVDGSINLRFDVSVTVTPLGPLQSDFFYCKKTSYRLGRQTRRKGNGIDYLLKTRRIRLSNVSQRNLARRSEKVNKPQLAQWGRITNHPIPGQTRRVKRH